MGNYDEVNCIAAKTRAAWSANPPPAIHDASDDVVVSYVRHRTYGKRNSAYYDRSAGVMILNCSGSR